VEELRGCSNCEVEPPTFAWLKAGTLLGEPMRKIQEDKISDILPYLHMLGQDKGEKTSSW
jgi:hypothetical protein